MGSRSKLKPDSLILAFSIFAESVFLYSYFVFKPFCMKVYSSAEPSEAYNWCHSIFWKIDNYMAMQISSPQLEKIYLLIHLLGVLAAMALIYILIGKLVARIKKTYRTS